MTTVSRPSQAAADDTPRRRRGPPLLAHDALQNVPEEDDHRERDEERDERSRMAAAAVWTTPPTSLAAQHSSRRLSLEDVSPPSSVRAAMLAQVPPQPQSQPHTRRPRPETTAPSSAPSFTSFRGRPQHPPTSNVKSTASTTHSERRSSFNTNAWLRSPLALVAEDALHHPTTVWLAFEQIVVHAGDALAICGRSSSSEPLSSSRTKSAEATAATHQRERQRQRQRERRRQKHQQSQPPAPRIDDETLTWREYHDQVLVLAKALVQLGFTIGDGAVVCGAVSSPALYLMNMAVLAAGGHVAHVRGSWSAEELVRDVFFCAKAKLLVVDRVTDNVAQAIRDSSRHELRTVCILQGFSVSQVLAWNFPVTVFSLADMRSLARDTPDVALSVIADNVRPADPCLLSFDYNPSGEVRAVCLSHDNVMFTAATLATSIGPVTDNDRLVGYLPLHQVASQIVELYLPLLSGIAVYCAPTSASSLADVIARRQPTIFFATPDTWEHISHQVYRAKSEVNAVLYRWAKTRASHHQEKLRYGHGDNHSHHRSLGYMLAKRFVLDSLRRKIGLESCRTCFSLLAPLDPTLAALFRTIDMPIFPLFGLAETTGIAVASFPHAWEAGKAGRAIPDMRLSYQASSGELFFAGRNVFLGYMRNGKIVPAMPQSQYFARGPTDPLPSTVVPTTCFRFAMRAEIDPADGFVAFPEAPRDFVVLSTGDWVPIEPFERVVPASFPEIHRAILVGHGRPFLSILLFLKTVSPRRRSASKLGRYQPVRPNQSIISGSASISSGASVSGVSHAAVAGSAGPNALLAEDALLVSREIGSTAVSVGDVVRCPRWAVHLDSMLELLPDRIGLSTVGVRKWAVMTEDYNELLDSDAGTVRRRLVEELFASLLDSLYS
ncbi:hypothetical protein P43SY_004442 [Pythium insidiosum]|uniref:AMP-dependent synthetase/ligase domain-containing protein n=1 Tax=Pythium insidiosum TaxID=114742 RepID=A0AAD5QDJ9_PYTIN|nr:hypothetical protein P43SY_004442 [Pythium insidiosum]